MNEQVLSLTDYFVQIVLLLVTLIYPWRIRREQYTRAFGVAFFLAFLWAIWRVIIFDPATHNDVPGMGYVAVGFVEAVIATCLFLLRCWLFGQKNK